MSDVTNNEEPTTEPIEAVETETVEVATEAAVEETVVEAAPAVAATPAATKVAATSAPAAAVAGEDDGRANPRKIREGIVISNKMDMTLVVAVNERVRHPRYGKTVQRTKKLYVHDANNDAKIGDRVRVQETRPLSKLKRWRLTDIVERAR